MYARILIPLGEAGGDRAEYLEIATRASMDAEDERSRAAWGSLASFVLKKGIVQLKNLRDALAQGCSE
jgi:hypothetical protein